MRMRGSLDDCILSNSFHRPHQSGQLWSLLFSAPASPISLGKLLQYLRDFCKTRLCKSWLLRSHNCKVLTIHGNKNAFVWPLTNIQNPRDKTFLNLDFHNNDKKNAKWLPESMPRMKFPEEDLCRQDVSSAVRLSCRGAAFFEEARQIISGA